jgi:D-glycero-alpha-D-manno-heptose-7-phosphate kinase
VAKPCRRNLVMIRSRAPLRVSFAGGGTDLDAYADRFGGAVLNATIDLAAHVTLTPRHDGHIVLRARDQQRRYEFDHPDDVAIEPLGPADRSAFQLALGVYQHMVQHYRNGTPLSFELTTSVDAPPGSGLGSSSTLVVALVAAFDRWLRLGLDAYALADTAVKVERHELGLAGGRQDQYAAAFGGWNHLVFRPDGQVVVHPLRLPTDVMNELESTMLLYDTGISRSSAEIIDGQVTGIRADSGRPLDAMHELRVAADAMTDAVLTRQLHRVGPLLEEGWRRKRSTASGIATPLIDAVHDAALAAGATGAKVSGAGGGGFMVLACPGTTRHDVEEALAPFGGRVRPMRFSAEGVTTWTPTWAP